MIEPTSAFGVVATQIDANHYSVIVWGRHIEATYYRADTGVSFGVGDRVFLERVDGAQLWQISSHAFGAPN